MTAVRAADGSYLLSGRHGGHFLEETWTRRAAAESGPAPPGPWTASSYDGSLACDAAGCIYRMSGHAAALIRDGAALAEDCAAVDLVVSPYSARRACPDVPIIDRGDVWRNGAHMPSGSTPGRIEILETVNRWRGDRPWVPKPQAGPPAATTSGPVG